MYKKPTKEIIHHKHHVKPLMHTFIVVREYCVHLRVTGWCQKQNGTNDPTGVEEWTPWCRPEHTHTSPIHHKQKKHFWG